jgi:tetratricopeptide (TPR) repeat protein
LVYLGKLHLTVGYEKESRRYFEQALSAAQECGSSLGHAHALVELALYCLTVSDPEKASQFLDEAEKLLSDDADSTLRLSLLFARLQMLVAAEEREKATQLYQSAAELPEAENTWVARARLSLLALSQGEYPRDQAWSSRIADFPEFAWRASWYQAQMAHASQHPREMRQEIEKAASRLRMIAEQLAENERDNYLRTQDAMRFQKWARQVM